MSYRKTKRLYRKEMLIILREYERFVNNFISRLSFAYDYNSFFKKANEYWRKISLEKTKGFKVVRDSESWFYDDFKPLEEPKKSSRIFEWFRWLWGRRNV